MEVSIKLLTASMKYPIFKSSYSNYNNLIISSNISLKELNELLKRGENDNQQLWLSNHKLFLSRIIILDYITRLIYKNTPDMFKNDEKAILFSEIGIEMYAHKLNAVQKALMLMPHLHSESLRDHHYSLNLLYYLISLETEKKELNLLNAILLKHIDAYLVLKKFGRFPNRNDILCREPTEEEIDFLDQHDYDEYTY